MKKYALFNADGILATRLIAGVHEIPDSAVSVSDEIFTRSMRETDGIWKLVNGEVIKAPLPAPTLDDQKAKKVLELSLACKADIIDGFDSDALGSTHHYPSKETDQMNLSSSVLASILPGNPEGWTTPFWCRTGDTWGFVPHTAAQIQQVGRDAKAHVLALMAKNATLAAQAMAVEDQEALDAIVW